jgi:hypothetical protein
MKLGRLHQHFKAGSVAGFSCLRLHSPVVVETDAGAIFCARRPGLPLEADVFSTS